MAYTHPSLAASWLHKLPWLLFGLGIMLMSWLHFKGVCHSDEWPAQQVCRRSASVDAVAEHAREALNNVGDARAWVSYAMAVREQQAHSKVMEPQQEKALLALLEKVAPNEPRALRLRALSAYREANWPEVTELLLILMTDHQDRRASRLLARSLSQPEVQARLQQRARQDGAWLAPLVRGLKEENLPISQASSMVWLALDAGHLPASLHAELIEDLKLQGRWMDSYALWMRLTQRNAEPVNNGDFERELENAGFEWRLPNLPPSKTGVQYGRKREASGNHYLELVMLGRRMPEVLVSQDVLVQPGKWTLQGRWMSRKFRAENGLVWALTCAQTDQEIAASAAMGKTDGQWQTLRLPFQVDRNCGPVLRLVLRTATRYDGLRGVSGDWAVDDVRLVPGHD